MTLHNYYIMTLFLQIAHIVGYISQLRLFKKKMYLHYYISQLQLFNYNFVFRDAYLAFKT